MAEGIAEWVSYIRETIEEAMNRRNAEMEAVLVSLIESGVTPEELVRTYRIESPEPVYDMAAGTMSVPPLRLIRRDTGEQWWPPVTDGRA